MIQNHMTSIERVVTTLGHREPDRVPLFLLFSFYGAKELGMPIKEYFSKPEYVVEAQLRMREKYRNDCFYAFAYAPIEVESWGGEVIFYEAGPPNSGEPIIRHPDDINKIHPPRVTDCQCLVRVLDAIGMLKERAGGETPIIGVVMSPFSLPVMQMGFEAYIDLIYSGAEEFHRLMRINEDFCVDWANAQLDAGAAAIAYFDPVSSPTIVPREIFLKTGYEVALRTIPRIKGPVAFHVASGRSLPIIGDISQTGAAAVAVSAQEDLSELKSACGDKLSVIGNLNGIEMHHWTSEQAEDAVRIAIANAGPGGGFILSDNHGEIPWQVPEDVLLAISDAVHKWGHYPLKWIEGREQ